MRNLAIGIAGIALTIAFGALQFLPITIPTWLVVAGLGVGVFLLGMSAGLLVAGRHKQRVRYVDHAFMRLHIFGDSRSPQRLAYSNIFRWYYLRHYLVSASSGERRAGSTILFIAFEPFVSRSSLYVRSPDIDLPSFEVKEFNERFAIITFEGAVPVGTLEVAVEP